MSGQHPRKKRENHGQTYTAEHMAWKAMIHRCTNPGHVHYPRFGGAGISVHEAWLDFTRFREDLGPCPEDHQLGRVDTSLGYVPGNTRWMTRIEAMRHSKVARLLEYEGRSQPIIAWAEERGIPINTLRGRLRIGWSVGQALEFEERLV